MSLLSRVFSLYHHHGASQAPEEDFFTEVIAYLFSERHDLLLTWAHHNNIVGRDFTRVASVQSQERFDAREHHVVGSRPDIVIHLESEHIPRKRAVLFLESKLLSKEHGLQLRRYADHLAQKTDCCQRVLIYMTREYDPKDQVTILGPNAGTVRFVQCRWNELYRFLGANTKETDKIERDILRFMEERGMDQDNQFSTVDILALMSFRKSLKMMKDTLWNSPVKKEYISAVGTPARQSSCLTHFERNHNYIMLCEMKNSAFEVGLGFYMGSGRQTDYPNVGLGMSVSPTSAVRKQVLAVFSNLAERPGWHGWKLSGEKSWSGVGKTRSLREFLSEENHMAAIENHFLSLLKEFSDIKKEFKDLPWQAAAKQPEPDEDDARPDGGL